MHQIDGLVFARHRCEIQGCGELFKTMNEYEHHVQKMHVNPSTQAIQSGPGDNSTKSIIPREFLCTYWLGLVCR